MLTGVSSGFIDLDRITHGLNRGNLLIIAGRPGMGKTSLALNMAQHVAIRERKAVGVFSLEMSQQELALRVLCSEADISFSRLRPATSPRRSGRASSRPCAPSAMRRCTSTTLQPDAPGGRLQGPASQGGEGARLVMLDYLQLIGRRPLREPEPGDPAISRRLKQLAKELELPVIALSQLSRQPERRGERPPAAARRPPRIGVNRAGRRHRRLHLPRRGLQPGRPQAKGLAELIIAKHRNGETGTIELVFLGETTLFRNLDRHGLDRLRRV